MLKLADATNGIYAMNSGLVAMADVARGGLGAFMNNITNTWDVAAGEVLVKACGGRVTDFDGEPIDYWKSNKVSVIASKSHLHEMLRNLIQSG